MRVAFWAAFGFVFYVYLVYPALLALVRRRMKVVDLPEDALPAVSLVIAAHNEEAVIHDKLMNSLALDYPSGRLSIVVASDGSVDRTNEIVRSFAAKGVRLDEVTPRGGKTRALNIVVPGIRSAVVVLSDANTMFRPDAVRKLVRHFADPAVGCVSGDVQLVNAAEEFAQSEGAYYRYERFIQRQESALGAIIGADGGMYALRHSLFAPIPDDVVVDDFVISMNVARAGFAVRYEPEAIAIEQGTLSSNEEFRRKVRVISGGIQALRRRVGLPRLSQPRLWWCYLSHKLGRWLVPVALLVMGIASVISSDPVVRWLAAGQAAFYAAALIHRPLVKAGWNLPVTTIPYYFCLMNMAAGVGLWRGLRGRQRAAWNRTTRENAGALPSADRSRTESS